MRTNAIAHITIVAVAALAMLAWRLELPLEPAAVVAGLALNAGLNRVSERGGRAAHAIGDAWHIGWWFAATLVTA